MKMQNLVIKQNGTLVVSSRKVAEDFEKEHAHVTRDIESLIGGVSKNGDTLQTLFIESEYIHTQNKQTYKEYLLTRDGFSLLVMGFNGQKALEWKLKYLAAFNAMEKQLQVSLPQNYVEALQALMDTEKIKQGLLVENIKVNNLLVESDVRVSKLTDTLASVGDLIQPREGEISLNEVAAQLGCYSVNGKPHGDFIFKVLNEMVRIIAPDQDCFSHRSGSTVLTDNYKHNVVLKVGMIRSIGNWVTNPLNKHSTKGNVTKYKFLKSSNLSNVYPKPKKIDAKEVF